MRFHWASISDTGRVRDHNEDSVLPGPGAGSEDSMVAAVADGMGGHVGGEVASRTAIETVAGVGGGATIRIHAANLAVIDRAARTPRLTGMGTTLTVAIIEPDGSVEIGHVGDSRAYLMHDGALARVTEDHSYVAEMIAAGRMTPEEAEVHPYRSVVTRAVGLEASLDVDKGAVSLEAGDRLLLCSDGLTSMISEDEIAGILTSEADPGAAVARLVEAANAAGGDDNISVVLIDASE